MATYSFRCARNPTMSLKFLFMTHLLAVGLFCNAIGAEANKNAILQEKRTFIEKANEQTWDDVKRQVQEMSRRGIFPMMIVSTLRPFGDWDYYFVDGGSMRWKPNPGQTFKEVDVPVGFVTDLTSIPRVFWQILRPEGRYAYAAVVHDYLYWTQDRSRNEADEILKLAMQDSKVDPKIIETIYLAVRELGQGSWDDNLKLKKSGEHRFLKKTPSDFTVSWSDWKKKPDVFADAN